ncbi:MAG TPA: hypothetical protein DCM08_05140 [Microscillaceae bacterium]|jgi:hypothetical protein|nr:hypothetical protein [Microscillaceae bacterium]
MTNFTQEEYLKLQAEFAAREKQIEEKIWVDTEAGRINDLLRQHFNLSIQEFTTVTLRYLSEFCNAFSAVIYVWDIDKKAFVAEGGYACNIEKLPYKQLAMGDGVVGQAGQSQKKMYFENIPPENIQIQAASVQLSAAALLVIPLVFNDKSVGVLEFVFLQNVDKKLQQVIDKVSQSVAAMLESIANNAITKKLLHESQEQAEALRAQEEEMRQNLEELKATQEAMEKKQQEMEALSRKLAANEEVLQRALQASKDKEKEIAFINEELKKNQTELLKTVQQLQETHKDLEKQRASEEQRMKAQLESTKSIVAKFQEKQKAEIDKLKALIEEKDKEIEALRHKEIRP